MSSDLKILLAEDNDVNQHLMLRILSRIGYDATLAKTGIQVLNKMDREDYDVILMDIQMPEMDGVTATKLIRAHYAAEKQPKIIALTAEVEGRDRFFAAGMDDILTKPVQIEAITAMLEKIREGKETSIDTDIPDRSSISLNEFQILDKKVLDDFMTLLGEEGNEGVAQLIELYKAGTPVMIHKIEAASANNNKDELLKQLHTLKGSSSQVGATRLEQLCGRLEVLVKQSGIEPFLAFLPGIQEEYSELCIVLDEYFSGK
jgi:CheY-like chemotaxis protein/HPt (histidine-containing phosphotransfer) domain-containing protein